MEKKNKVYYAEGDPNYGGQYIAAKNSKEAKSYALLHCDCAETVENPFINVKVTRCWSVKETDYEGELNIKQINELDLAWWSCPECDGEHFEIIDKEYYKCLKCGKTIEIPYIN